MRDTNQDRTSCQHQAKVHSFLLCWYVTVYAGIILYYEYAPLYHYSKADQTHCAGVSVDERKLLPELLQAESSEKRFRVVVIFGADDSEELAIGLLTVATRKQGWHDFQDERDVSLPPYEAISYAWGDGTPAKHTNCRTCTSSEISCDEPRASVSAQQDVYRSMAVSETLYEILRNLRLDDKDRMIWLDAIAID